MMKKLRFCVLLAGLLLAAYYFLALPLGLEIPFLSRTATDRYGWNLILVNRDYSIPPDYQVELTTLSNGQKVDSRIYPHLQDMFDDMRAEGVYPTVASGYRTQGKQRQLLEEKTAEYEKLGWSWFRARKEALLWVSRPGTSEHQLGLAVDINQDSSRSSAQQVYDWLAENAHRYGFIYRYPAEKTALTGVAGEPWHYRYVGGEAALQIYEQGLCLEEYIDSLRR